MSTPPAATPYLSVHHASEALAWYARAFGAVETLRLQGPEGGAVAHAEFTVEGARVMLADEFEGTGVMSPRSLEGTTVQISVYVADVDAFVARAVKEGATLIRRPEQQFYGDRVASVVDPYGHCWIVSTRVEDMSTEEMKTRFEKLSEE